MPGFIILLHMKLCFLIITKVLILPSTFSLSLMCCRLHPVSSLLRSDSWWYDSSLEWAFLRSLGLDDTQQDVVLPIVTPRVNVAPQGHRRGHCRAPERIRSRAEGEEEEDGRVTSTAGSSERGSRPGHRRPPDVRSGRRRAARARCCGWLSGRHRRGGAVPVQGGGHVQLRGGG